MRHPRRRRRAALHGTMGVAPSLLAVLIVATQWTTTVNALQAYDTLEVEINAAELDVPMLTKRSERLVHVHKIRQELQQEQWQSEDSFSTVIQHIEINQRRFSLSTEPLAIPRWDHDPNITRRGMLLAIHFHDNLDGKLRYGNVGHLALRHVNGTRDIATIKLKDDNKKMWTFVDFTRLPLRKSKNDSIEPPPPPGPYAVTLRLASPFVDKNLELELGRVNLFLPHTPPSFSMADVWSGNILHKFFTRCEDDPAFEIALESRMIWAEILVAIFSVSYCGAVQWLGPLDFTRWQERCYQMCCISSAFFQLVFLCWLTEALSIRVAFPFAVAFGFVYFSSFNLTNILILLETATDTDTEPADDPMEDVAAGRELRTVNQTIMYRSKRARYY